jgi:hypothetical protein
MQNAAQSMRGGANGRRQSGRIVPDRLASVDRAPMAKTIGPKQALA